MSSMCAGVHSLSAHALAPHFEFCVCRCPLARLPLSSLQAKLQGETFELMTHVEECLQKLQR